MVISFTALQLVLIILKTTISYNISSHRDTKAAIYRYTQIGVSPFTGLDYWTGMDYWTDLFWTRFWFLVYFKYLTSGDLK